jgi:hypothetical protein
MVYGPIGWVRGFGRCGDWLPSLEGLGRVGHQFTGLDQRGDASGPRPRPGPTLGTAVSPLPRVTTALGQVPGGATPGHPRSITDTEPLLLAFVT